MSWNYRVMRFPDLGGEDFEYRVVEAHYFDGVVKVWSERATPTGDTIEELRADLLRMMGAPNKPVLDKGGKEIKEEKL